MGRLVQNKLGQLLHSIEGFKESTRRLLHLHERVSIIFINNSSVNTVSKKNLQFLDKTGLDNQDRSSTLMNAPSSHSFTFTTVSTDGTPTRMATQFSINDFPTPLLPPIRDFLPVTAPVAPRPLCLLKLPFHKNQVSFDSRKRVLTYQDILNY